MALGPRLDLRHTQSLVMTPQLRQAIKLLQLSNIEVNAFVEEELERNPLLERDERAEVEVERPALDQPIAAVPGGIERALQERRRLLKIPWIGASDKEPAPGQLGHGQSPRCPDPIVGLGGLRKVGFGLLVEPERDGQPTE
jgi:DNA-directed RNA polymerase specialized sigma54-like protein